MDRRYGEQYEELYRQHWWWRAREMVLVSVIKSLGFQSQVEILDVGCGNSLFFPELSKFGDVRGIEIDESLIAPDCPYRDRVYTNPLGDPAYDRWQFDLITALDVIEHIEEDGGAVQDMLAMLKPGGKLIITVPAFNMLWDRHDEINHHYRRYTRRDVRRLVSHDGEVIMLRYLFHCIFVPRLGLKFLNRMFAERINYHRMPGRVVNRAMEMLCLWEYRALGRLNIPFGTSVLAVVEKPGMPAETPGRYQ